ncbi:MAG: ATP synthase subunit I [Desulfobacterales bacterium]|nr:ATP synthase subunit I [Desulfobacterales bacterium]
MVFNVHDVLTAFPAGVGIGIFYFGGLLWTVRRLPTSQRPAFLTFGSFFIRNTLSLGGFYLVMQAAWGNQGAGQWQRLLICLAGFMLVRFTAVRRWGPARTSTMTHKRI